MEDDMSDYLYITVGGEPSYMVVGEEEEEEEEAPPAQLAAMKKAPGSLLRFFVLPEDHELAFDFFSGVPTLHARPRRHQAAAAAAPPQTAGLPSRVAGFWPFSSHAPRVEYESLEVLFWASAAPGEEGLVAVFPPPATFVGGLVWQARGAVAAFRAALAMEAPGVDGDGRAPLFFTFSPGMVVVYARKRGRKRGVVLVAGEDYHALARRPLQQFRRPDAVSALTPGAAIF